jgi:hypothetical protein
MRSVVYHRLLVPYPHALSSSDLLSLQGEAGRNQNALCFYQNAVFMPDGVSVAVVAVVELSALYRHTILCCAHIP